MKSKSINVLASLIIGLTVFELNSIQANAAWVQASNGWGYTDGGCKVTGWNLIDGRWYFFNSNGIMQQAGLMMAAAGII